jgi:hypothetical protein
MGESLARRIPALPLARPGLPEEVANLVSWLNSNAASYASGAIYAADGASGVGSRPSAPEVDDDPRYDWVTGRTRT